MPRLRDFVSADEARQGGSGKREQDCIFPRDYHEVLLLPHPPILEVGVSMNPVTLTYNPADKK